MKQTAVEFLEQHLFLDDSWKRIFEQAKEMEKQQILDACIHGFRIDAESDNWLGDSKQAKMYYNQTFKKV